MKKRVILLSLVFIAGTGSGATDKTTERMKKLPEKYRHLTAETCKVQISQDRRDPLEGKQFPESENHQIACVIGGLKDLYWTLGSHIEEELKALDPALVELINKKDGAELLSIRYPNPKPFTPADAIQAIGLIFNPQGKRNAYLFAKYWLELQLEIAPARGSWYMIGTLLNYDKKDIDFFHQKIDFIEYRSEKRTPIIESISGKDFIMWPAPIKSDFNKFEKTLWPSREMAKNLKNAQISTQQWLNKQKNKTIEQLAAENKQLVEQLKRFRLSVIQETIKAVEETASTLKKQVDSLKEEQELIKQLS